MKIYKKKQAEKQVKSWGIQLSKDDGYITLEAVDSKNGDFVANLITFFDDGRVALNYNVNETMERNQYNPGEHGNRFDSMGRIVIDNQGDE